MCVPMVISAQTAVDAYSISQNDLRGTARYMSMAGAFGALGGDLSAINNNPGGIGVYRNSDIGITFDLDFQSSNTQSLGQTTNTKQSKLNCNNLGYVGVLSLKNKVMPFINWGISYNRPVSFNRRYSGNIGDINSSLSNYIANVTNANEYTSYDLAFEEATNGDILYDPYIDSNAPWLSIMAFNSFINNPGVYDSNGIGSNFKGLMNSNTNGYSEYEVNEQGGVDEFDVSFGGNIKDMLYWGIGIGLNNMDFAKYTYYGESLSDATVLSNDNGALDEYGTASYGLENWLTTTGNGWNFKVGVIYKPINELRIGLAYHTPTYWSLRDESFSKMNYETINSYGDYVKSGTEDANAGYIDEVSYRITTPWKINASVATVLGGKAILSMEYERIAYNDMNIQYDNGFGSYTENKLVSQSISDYYKAMNIYLIGAEYRLSSKVSLRLGYAYQSSPVNDEAINGGMEIMTSGTMPAYTFDKSTQYITGGLGYRYKAFYVDIAYVHKMRKSEYHAFSSYTEGNDWIQSPKSTIKDNNNQFVLSIGYRF